MKPLRPTHKLIFPRTLYTPAGNGPLGFFDTPPAPSSSSRSSQRLSLESTPRASGESHWHQSQSQQSGNSGSGPPPYSLALPTSHSNLKHATNFPGSAGPGYSSNSLSPGVLPSGNPHSVAVGSEDASDQVSSGRPRKRPRLDPQVTLDVGAYGIPKRRSPANHISPDSPRSLHTFAVSSDTPLSVQVGEDAYFISESGDAMGVADGVGGWSKRMSPEEMAKKTPGTTPSALFAKRLMHYCAEEAAEAVRALHVPLTTSSTNVPALPKEQPKEQPYHFMPSSWRSPNPLFNAPPIRTHTPPVLDTSSYAPYWHWDGPTASPIMSKEQQLAEWQEELDETLEDLSDGLDVLSIMSSGVDTATLMDRALNKTVDAHTFSASVTGSTCSRPAATSSAAKEQIPLMAGSSTALVAVLDHVLLPRDEDVAMDVQMSSSPSSSSPLKDFEVSQEQESGCEPTAVIKIAHVGDCMGMLIRDNEIVWRNEEMWTEFNTPVQLSPFPGGPTPKLAAQVAQLKVQNGDILVLASDGLSDNLWDDEILEEIRNVKASWETTVASATPADSSAAPSEPQVESSDVLSLLRRRHGAHRHNLASVLSEALCSRAKGVSEGRLKRTKKPVPDSDGQVPKAKPKETPFEHRAREYGRIHRGGKEDDISVVVAVISPAKASPSEPTADA